MVRTFMSASVVEEHDTPGANGFRSVKPSRYHCGPEETRTPDLLHAMEALYQLSYRPDQSL